MRVPFIWARDPSSFWNEAARVVTVPPRIPDKEALLRWYADGLGLPEYFGANWDAFDECLRDLSWVDEHTVVLYHHDLPMDGCRKDRRIYLKVLASAAVDWKVGEAHEVVVAFSPECELLVRAHLNPEPV